MLVSVEGGFKTKFTSDYIKNKILNLEPPYVMYKFIANYTLEKGVVI